MATVIARPLVHDDKKRRYEEPAAPMPVKKTKDKLEMFQKESLQDSVDYISLQSSLELLQSRAEQIKRDMKELSNLKRCIRDTSSVKDIARILKNNKSYLNEINYKGSYIKCPAINWSRDYGLDMDLLNETTEQINGQYEIIKRDKLF